MWKYRISNWAQFFTGMTIIIGLVLVVWELQQARELAKAQLISDNFSIVHASRIALMGENPAATIHKACVQPEKLTGEDIQVLNNFFWSQVTTPMRIRSLGIETGLYATEEWRGWYPGLFSVVAGTPYGRYWWGNIYPFFEQIDPELASFGKEYLSEISSDYSCSDYPEGYLKMFAATQEE